jgi:hypothetical protein
MEGVVGVDVIDLDTGERPTGSPSSAVVMRSPLLW